MVDLRFKYNDKFGLIITRNDKFFRGKIKTFDREMRAIILDDIKEGENIFFPENIERLKIIRSQADINDMIQRLSGWEEELRKMATPDQIKTLNEKMHERK